ncbi:MAG: lyase [Alphaproteobacteria bacterium]|nr:lyase [Alphaproteobacteria bacterium]HCP01607.1 lyase [Rhodospirillaceae bacterium]
MFHHVSIGVSDLDRSAKFYDAVLGALGHVRFLEKPGTLSWWPEGGGPALWINLRDPLMVIPDDGRHIALQARSREQVDAFHLAAIALGATDDGPPGVRPEYRDTYYGAFVLDLDGHKLEAVHAPRE